MPSWFRVLGLVLTFLTLPCARRCGPIAVGASSSIHESSVAEAEAIRGAAMTYATTSAVRAPFWTTRGVDVVLWDRAVGVETVTSGNTRKMCKE